MYKKIYDKIANSSIKKRFAIVNIIVVSIIAIFVTITLIATFTGNSPKNLEKTTGTVAKFKQHDKNWADYIGGSGGSYFNVTFEDGSFFEAKGVSYNLIDRKLFENLHVGDVITILHNNGGFWHSDGIYGIEFNGETYLSYDDVLIAMEDNEKGIHALGLTMAGLCIAVGGVCLFILNYNLRKKYPKKSV